MKMNWKTGINHNHGKESVLWISKKLSSAPIPNAPAQVAVEKILSFVTAMGTYLTIAELAALLLIGIYAISLFPLTPLNSENFDIDEDSMQVGINLLRDFALQYK